MVRRKVKQPPSILILGISILLSWIIFYPSLSGPFVSDDQNAIVTNELVSGSHDVRVIFTTYSWWGRTRSDAPGYRPLTTWTFALNHRLGGNWVAPYHAVNLVLHGLVAWLAYLLSLRLGSTRTAAYGAGLLFCLLPIHSEAVVWVVGRAELLAAAGFAGSLLLLLDYRRTGAPLRLLAAAFLFLGGMLSKENTVTLLAAPLFFALLLDRYPVRLRRDAIALVSLAVALAAYLLLRASTGSVLPNAAGDRLDNPLTALAGLERAAGSLSILGRYLYLTIWPRPLSVDYSYNALGIVEGFAGDRFTIIGLIAIVALTAISWYYRSRKPYVTAGLLLSAATYSIVSNTLVLIGTIMGERLFYLPTLGLCIAAGPAVAWLAARGKTGLAALALVGLTYAYADVTRAAVWQTPVGLFEAATRAYPDSARAHMELGTAYGKAGRDADAIAAFAAATRIKPDYAAAWYNLGNLYARRRSYAEADRAYSEALAHNPRLVQAWYNSALVHRLRGNPDLAVQALRTGTELAPLDPEIRTTLADTLLMVGRNEEAAEAYSAALTLGAESTSALTNRGVATQRAWGCDRAIGDYLAVLRIAPNHRVALANAVGCLHALGRFDEATELRARSEVANRDLGR